MRLLLDNPIFLWAVAGSTSLKSQARLLIEAADQAFVSAVSIWELRMKALLGGIQVDPDEMAAISDSGFIELPIASVHAAGVGWLPLHQHDPFDRLLIAQAIAEPLHLPRQPTQPFPAMANWGCSCSGCMGVMKKARIAGLCRGTAKHCLT
jgi:PIN domain nuclease of toxin-antitoxin system